jgi:hypothetical protein
MLRIYARVLAAALVVIAAAAAVGILKEGLGVSVLYVGSAAVFAYAGFRRGEAAFVRSVVAVMGSVLLVLGLLLALAMGILGFPFEGKGWEVGLAHAALQPRSKQLNRCTVAAVLEEPKGVSIANRRDGHPDGFQQSLSTTRLGFAQEALDLGEGFLDGIKIRRVGRQV